jgi:hypothetical protein
VRLECLALGILLVAGCSQPGGQEPVAERPTLVTNARDLANGTAPGSHVHDYWQGRGEMQVLDAQTGEFAYDSGRANGTLSTFRPEDGTVVLQGTGILEVTPSWELTPASPADAALGPQTDFDWMELWVQTAADAAPHPVERVENGQTLRFNSTNDQDDPPHYEVSLWRFLLVAQNPDGKDTKFSGSIRMTAKAFKTLPLPTFPPHADQWSGSLEINLLEKDQAVQAYVATPVSVSCNGGCVDDSIHPDDGRVVPFDARTVEVVVSTDATSLPVPLALRWHGADSTTFQDIAPSVDDPGRRVYTIGVGPSVGDSPYAKQSLWEFRVQLETPYGVGAWHGTFHVKATAMR